MKNRNYIRRTLIMIALSGIGSLNCQDSLRLENPSFELSRLKLPKSDQIIEDPGKPKSWIVEYHRYDPEAKRYKKVKLLDGLRTESPWILSSESNKKDNSFTPFSGESCLGLYVTKEAKITAITEAIDGILKYNACYTFSIYLSWSSEYDTFLANEFKDFSTGNACVLRIWAGNDKNSRQQLIGVSPTVYHGDWKNYTFNFTSDGNYTHLTLEAYYDGNAFYDGHLLVDHASPVVRMDCGR